MVWPILISVSLTPAAYFFSAAGAAPESTSAIAAKAMMENRMTAPPLVYRRRVSRSGALCTEPLKARGKRRMRHLPLRRALEGAACAQHQRVRAAPADDLQSDGQALGGDAAGDRGGGLARQIEGQGIR